jgi:hypothetical protein
MEHQKVARTLQAEPQSETHAVTEQVPSTQSAAHPFLYLQRMIGNQRVHHLIQAKFQIDQLFDKSEQEADWMAKQVLSAGATKVAQPVEHAAGSPAAVSDIPSIVHEVLNSPGQPLDPDAREVMESRFGYDFSQVRVHTDEKAAESAQAVNASAYTVGRDVVFGAGQYTPGTSEGGSLMAHELTHVVQQQKCLWSGYGTQIQRQADKSSSAKEAVVQGAGESGSRIEQVADAFMLLEEAKQLATKTPPDFIHAHENVSQVYTWLQTVFSENNIFRHFGGHALNLNTAITFKGIAMGALYSLRATLKIYIDSNAIRPMSPGKWKHEIDAIKASREYLEILAGARKPEASLLFQSVERAERGAYGTVALTILGPLAIGAAVEAGPAVVTAIVSEAELVAGAASSLAAPLITLVLTHPVEAMFLSEWGVGTILQIASAGGIQEYLKGLSTPQGALQAIYDILVLRLLVRSSRGPSPQSVDVPTDVVEINPQRITVRVKQPPAIEPSEEIITPESPSRQMKGVPTKGTPGSQRSSAQFLGEKEPPGFPIPAGEKAIQDIILDEHEGLHPKVAARAARNGISAKGAGGKGADVVLADGGGREVSVRSKGAFTEEGVGGHLVQEARQAGTNEIFLQINTPGASRAGLAKMLPKLIRYAPDLKGIWVEISGPDGEVWFSGPFKGPEEP